MLITSSNKSAANPVEKNEFGKKIMAITDISSYCNRPCKFRLRSGKEVYGVIWQVKTDERREFYFASSGEYDMLMAAEAMEDLHVEKIPQILVNIEDFVAIECLGD